MKNYCDRKNGYRHTIQLGIEGARTLTNGMTRGKYSGDEGIRRLRDEIQRADAIVVGAGAGLSTSAGLTYSGERFE
ncbi:MAG: hypothetical protein HXL19_06535, partial [Peptostreptococcus sp.]|nr:hypothetical protein [Peptostreptococcus sp.]